MRGRAAALLLGVALAAPMGACSRSKPVGGRPAAAAASAAASAPAAAPASARASAPAAAPASAPSSAPASAPASAPDSAPDVYAAAPAPGTIITDAEGRRYPVNQALVTVAAGTSREAVDAIAAAVRGRVVGQIPREDLYQIVVPTKTADELAVAMDRLRREPRVKDVRHNLMRRPAPR